MCVSLEEARAGIIRHYKGQGWNEEQIGVDALRSAEVFRIYDCVQKDEEQSKHLALKLVDVIAGFPIYQNLPVKEAELPASDEGGGEFSYVQKESRGGAEIFGQNRIFD